YIKWKSFRDTDDARYIGLVMPRVLGRLPYGPDTGARNVDSLLNQQILPVLSQQLLMHMAAGQKPHTLTLGWDEEEGIVLEFDRTEGVHA
ncbi:type VI secretion system contractile sheath domain-containing protein, partial [Enterobacter hormaechei]